MLIKKLVSLSLASVFMVSGAAFTVVVAVAVLFAVVLMLTSLGPAPSFLMVPPDSEPCVPAGLMLLKLPKATLKPFKSSTPVPLICIAVTAVLLFVWTALGGVVMR